MSFVDRIFTLVVMTRVTILFHNQYIKVGPPRRSDAPGSFFGPPIQRLQFSQFLMPTLTNPTAPYILYWDGTRMQVGTWGNQITAANYQSKMLCFKFGGVVGMDLNTGDFTSANIKFNPMTTPSSVTNWATVPSYITADYPNVVSDATYHNLANVKAGRGDPCKLVGLTVTQIQSGTIDNGKYRLPTNAENQTFYGSASDNGATSIWTANDANAANPATMKFTSGTANGAILPASGRRDMTTGTVASQKAYSTYWSSTPDKNFSGFDLYFSGSEVWPSNTCVFAYGMPVRCVPQ
jgi:hypothetical protein